MVLFIYYIGCLHSRMCSHLFVGTYGLCEQAKILGYMRTVQVDHDMIYVTIYN